MKNSIQQYRHDFALTAVDEQKKMVLIGTDDESLLAAWHDQGVDVIEMQASMLDELGDFEFDLALVSNLLEEATAAEDIVNLLLKIARIAREVRIYPLENSSYPTAEWVAPILVQLQMQNYGSELKEGADKKPLLRIWANECLVD